MAGQSAIGARLRSPLGIATATVAVVAVVAAAIMGAKIRDAQDQQHSRDVR